MESTLQRKACQPKRFGDAKFGAAAQPSLPCREPRGGARTTSPLGGKGGGGGPSEPRRPTQLGWTSLGFVLTPTGEPNPRQGPKQLEPITPCAPGGRTRLLTQVSKMFGKAPRGACKHQDHAREEIESWELDLPPPGPRTQPRSPEPKQRHGAHTGRDQADPQPLIFAKRLPPKRTQHSGR